MTNSIDLIPTEYREGLLRRSRLRTAAWALIAACMLIVLASFTLAKESTKLRLETEKLRTGFALNALHQEQLVTMDTRLTELNEEWMLLQGLRSGAAAEDLFVIIDQALPGTDVWFQKWKFRRAGVVAPDNTRTVDTGYLLLVSNSAEVADTQWQVETHMNIVGQARDHAALSRFVRGLYGHSEIQEVKLNQTRVREYANTTVVDFELAIILHSEPAV